MFDYLKSDNCNGEIVFYYVYLDRSESSLKSMAQTKDLHLIKKSNPFASFPIKCCLINHCCPIGINIIKGYFGNIL